MGLVLESGVTWGDAAYPWQIADVRAILAGEPLLHFISRPRGASKTSDLAAVVVAFLLELLPPGARGFGFAADRDQARLLIEAVAGFVVRTPGLAEVLRVQQLKVTNIDTGAEFEAQAADAASAHGLRAHLLIADELAQWPSTGNARGVWEAVVSTAPKVAGARLVCLTTAGSPDHWSFRVIETARSDEDWRVAELPGPVPWLDPAALQAQQALLSESAFARLHLNQWTEIDDVTLGREVVQACRRDDGALPPVQGRYYVHGVDLSMTSDYTVVATAHLEQRGQDSVVVVDRLRTWKPSRARPIDQEEVESYIVATARRYRGRVVMDPFQAAYLQKRLRTQGVAAKDAEMTAAGNNKRAIVLHRLLKDARLDIPGDDPELVDELGALAFRENSPGIYKLDMARGGLGHHDRSTAISIAAEALLAGADAPRLVMFDDEPDPDPIPRHHLESTGAHSFAPPVLSFGLGDLDVLDPGVVGGQASPFAAAQGAAAVPPNDPRQSGGVRPPWLPPEDAA